MSAACCEPMVLDNITMPPLLAEIARSVALALTPIAVLVAPWQLAQAEANNVFPFDADVVLVVVVVEVVHVVVVLPVVVPVVVPPVVLVVVPVVVPVVPVVVVVVVEPVEPPQPDTTGAAFLRESSSSDSRDS